MHICLALMRGQKQDILSLERRETHAQLAQIDVGSSRN
jgi:hypothetical protein